MIEIDIHHFSATLPFVSTATTDLYDSVATGFSGTFDMLVRTTMGDAVAAGMSPMVEQLARSYVILATFLDKLHAHDVILTDNGFGVVSNQNLAPASQQRVQSLKDELSWRRDAAMYSLVDCLRSVAGWCDTPQAATQIETLLWSPVHVAPKAKTPGHPTYADLALLAPEVACGDAMLRRKLGDAMIDQLLAEERADTYQEKHLEAIRLMRQFMMSIVTAADEPQREMFYLRVASFVESHSQQFAAYTESDVYRANHTPRYGNKKDDPTFFF